MLRPSDFVFGPWRAVSVLAVTQILAWGTIYYPVAITAPLIATDHGWTKAYAMAGFSTALLVSGLASRHVGTLIDRYGGHRVMSAGSLIGAIGLLCLAHANAPSVYFATWMLLGLAMSASLYNASFATIGRIFGKTARRPITMLTVIGGVASTLSWPSTYLLTGTLGWRTTYLIYAALLLFVAAPLHCWALPRECAATEPAPTHAAQGAPPTLLAPRGLPFMLVAAGFAAFSFLFSGFVANFLSIFSRLGLERDVAIALSALVGPAQIVARFSEFVIARNAHPLQIVRVVLCLLLVAFAVLVVLGVSPQTSAALILSYGIANGLMTIATATVPLALFGATGYGRLIGSLAGPPLLMQSVAPFVVAFVAEKGSDAIALTVLAAFVAISLTCFLLVRRPTA
jgi:MFS family permease